MAASRVLSLTAAMLINLLSSRGSSRRFCRFALAQLFHANFVGMRTQHPTIDIVDSCIERCPAAMFADADQVTPAGRGGEKILAQR